MADESKMKRINSQLTWKEIDYRLIRFIFDSSANPVHQAQKQDTTMDKETMEQTEGLWLKEG